MSYFQKYRSFNKGSEFCSSVKMIELYRTMKLNFVHLFDGLEIVVTVVKESLQVHLHLEELKPLSNRMLIAIQNWSLTVGWQTSHLVGRVVTRLTGRRTGFSVSIGTTWRTNFTNFECTVFTILKNLKQCFSNFFIFAIPKLDYRKLALPLLNIYKKRQLWNRWHL